MANPAYQDWAKYIVPSADKIFGDSQGALQDYNGVANDCSPWDYVIIRLQNHDASVNLRVSIVWQGYQPGTFFQPNDIYVVGPSQTSNIVLPTRGRSVAVFYHVMSGVATLGVDYAVIGKRGPISKYDVKSTTTQLFNDNTAYVAGGNQLLSAAYWYEGPVQIAVTGLNGTAAELALSYLDPTTGVLQDFAVLGILGLTNNVPRLVYFPPSPVSAYMNNIGAAQTMTIEASPAPVP